MAVALIKAGANVFATDKDGKTAMDYVGGGNPEMTKLREP